MSMHTSLVALAFFICTGFGRRAPIKTKQAHGRLCKVSNIPKKSYDTLASYLPLELARLQPGRELRIPHAMHVFARLLSNFKTVAAGFQITSQFAALNHNVHLDGLVHACSSRGCSRSEGVAMQETLVPDVPDATLDRVFIGKASFKSESLPLSYVSSWPIWLASPDGSTVTQLPDGMSEEGWVNPHSFEQLWIPRDLPAPASRAALGMVLKNGAPRYLFPTMETTVMTRTGILWHNRGLNSFPLAKTWMIFGEVEWDALRISAYTQQLPAKTPDGQNMTEAGPGEVAANTTAEPWTPLLPLTPVETALNKLFDVISNAPDALGKGFCFLLIPLEDEAARLPSAKPGNRTRIFLSDVNATPTSLDPEDRESWVWSRGECDISAFAVAPGGQSEFLPAPYKPLFQDSVGDKLADLLS